MFYSYNIGMKTHLALFFITAAMAVTSSLPLSKIWDTKTQFLDRTGLLPQHDVVSTYSTRLPHEIKGSRESLTRPLLLKSKQTHVSMATAPVMSMDELFSIAQSILNLLPQIYEIVADAFYDIFKEKYGINDPLSENIQKISDIVQQLANTANYSYLYFTKNERFCVIFYKSHEQSNSKYISL